MNEQQITAAQIVPLLPAEMQNSSTHTAVNRAIQQKDVEYLRSVLTIAKENQAQKVAQRNSLVSVDVSPTIIVFGDLNLNSHNTTTSTTTNERCTTGSSIFDAYFGLIACLIGAFLICSLASRPTDAPQQPGIKGASEVRKTNGR